MKKGLYNAILTAILFMTLEPVSKLIAGDINPYAITLWRFLIGSVILIPFAIHKIKKDHLTIQAKDIFLMALLGILFICISMVTLQMAVKKADAPSLIAIIFSSNSVFSIIFAIFFIKEKMTKEKIIAIILCTIGVIVSADFSSGTNLISILLALFAAISFSLYSVLSQKYTTNLGSVVQTSIVFTLGSIALLIGLLIAKTDVIPSFNITNISILVYLGLFVTGIGYWSYFKAIEKGGAIMGSLAFFIKPILSPVASLVINAIIPEAKIFIALLFIVAGSYFATYKINK